MLLLWWNDVEEKDECNLFKRDLDVIQIMPVSSAQHEGRVADRALCNVELSTTMALHNQLNTSIAPGVMPPVTDGVV